MASVSSLDQDMRRLRLDRYTPQAAAEVRTWIEGTLNERLPAGDLLDSLKDGVALCKLANLVLPAPGIRFKASAMPFTQRENIAQFLLACERAPLNMPSHDRFLTVDLYDGKDPAQVLQCLGAFSRAANEVNPARFRTVIGPKRAPGTSPTRKPANGGVLSESTDYNRGRGGSTPSQRGVSPALTGGSDSSRTADGGLRPSPGGPVSSWSKKIDEGSTAPAWNIHQYGYMGGASQGNQGISFGARRQITSPGVSVPSLAEKEKLRKEQELEAQRAQAQAEEAEQRRLAQRKAEEERERIAEEERWEEETRKARAREKQKVEEQKRQWEEEERQWKLAEDARLQEEQEAEAARQRSTAAAPGLHGQYLSEYQRDTSRRQSEGERIRDLERQLEEARERERQYNLERQGHTPAAATASTTSPRDLPQAKPHDSWAEDERKRLQGAWSDQQAQQQRARSPTPPPPLPGPRPLPTPFAAPTSSRPLPTPSTPTPTVDNANNDDDAPPPPLPGPRPLPTTTAPRTTTPPPALPGPRPLSSPRAAASSSPFTRPRPASPFTRPSPGMQAQQPHDLSQTSAAERAGEDARRVAAEQRTRQGGLMAKGLLEREMERERERQREWEGRTMGGRG